jgi:hypothetical protein
MTGYDVIGDLHGEAGKLAGLLDVLGYEERDGAWRHPSRTAVFVGDLIDRGDQQQETIDVVRPMVAAGTARAVLGNHEFNAIAFATRDPAKPNEFLRSRFDDDGPRHRDQHQQFLDAVGADSSRHLELIEWFESLPMWLELDGLRVVHACWDQHSIDVLRPLLNADATMPPAFIEASNRKGTPEYEAVEIVLKGPEIELGTDHEYLDSDGHPRTSARHRWWDPKATTLQAAAELPGRGGALPAAPIVPPVQPYGVTECPVVVGHYWRRGAPELLAPNVACVDYSAVKGGPLVAYRWSGEKQLTKANFRRFPEV